MLYSENCLNQTFCLQFIHVERFPTLAFNSGVRGLWYLTPLSTIFQLYRGSQFYWWRKLEYLKKATDCRKSLTNFIT